MRKGTEHSPPLSPYPSRCSLGWFWLRRPGLAAAAAAAWRWRGPRSSHRRLAQRSSRRIRSPVQQPTRSCKGPHATRRVQSSSSSSRAFRLSTRLRAAGSVSRTRRARSAPPRHQHRRRLGQARQCDTVVCCCHPSVVVAGPPRQRPSCRSSQRGPVARRGGGVPGPGWRPARQPRRVVRGARPSSAAPVEPPRPLQGALGFEVVCQTPSKLRPAG